TPDHATRSSPRHISTWRHHLRREHVMRKLASATLCAVSFCAAGCWSADAQQYPVRPIRLVVPFAPGGGSDYNARLVGAHMRERLGQNVIVDNRPGAGGSTGADTVIRSTPDGYTIPIISTSYLLN